MEASIKDKRKEDWDMERVGTSTKTGRITMVIGEITEWMGREYKQNHIKLLYDPNGKVIFDGTFKDDKYHGSGTEYNT